MGNLALRIGLSLLVSIILSACSAPAKKQDVQIIIPNEAGWQAARENPNSAIHHLAKVHARMNEVLPMRYNLGLSEQTEINSYATRQNNLTLIVFTNGFLQSFGNDDDILATTLGHELAHHKLGHTDPNYHKHRAAIQDSTSQILGTIASYFVPFSGLLVGPTVRTIGLTFNRGVERNADDLGMRWAINAGYSPCGSYRLARQLSDMGSGTTIAFLSSHPGNTERMENSQNFAQNIGLNCNQ